MCFCRFKFTRDCDEQMALMRDRSILPLSNRVILQQEFRLAFTANQELIRRSNFLADISPAHMICMGLEKDHAIFSVYYCIPCLNSFRYGSPRCSVFALPVLRHAIRDRFSFALAPPFTRFLFFFTYYDKYNPWRSTIQLLQDQQYVCTCCS